MTDSSKLAEQQARGDHAARLRDDPLIKEFFEKVEAVVFETIKSSAPDQNDLRERAYYQLEAIENLKLCFQKTVNDGEFAAKELRLMNKETKE